MKKLSLSHYSGKRIALTALALLGAYIMASSLLVQTAWAAQPLNLTNNSFDDVAPQIDDGLAVWSGFDGSHFQIFYALRLGFGWFGPYQLTYNNYDNLSPQVRNYRVVWYGGGGLGGTSEIFLWAPFDFGVSVIKQITVNNYEDWYPEIDENGIIAWMGLPGSSWRIFWCDGLPQSPIINSIPSGSGADVRPEIDGGKIVWMTLGWYACYYDTVSGTGPITLFPSTGPFPWPQIDNGIVVYAGGPVYPFGTDTELYMYDSSLPISSTNPKQITNNLGNDGAVQIDAGKIVWQSGDVASNTFDIWFMDLSVLTPQPITTNSWDDISPQIDGGRITWMAKSPPPSTATDWETWYKDTVSGYGPVRLHNNNNVDDINPQIWDGTVGGATITTPWIVWQHWRTSPPPANWEIYAATP